MLTLKKTKIMRMSFEGLFHYLNGGIAKECFGEFNMSVLLSSTAYYIEDEEYDIL